MPFSPEFAERRFGYGLSPVLPPVASAEGLLASLTAPDAVATQFPIEGFEVFRSRMSAQQELRKDHKKLRGTPEADALRKKMQVMQQDARKAKAGWFIQTLNRRIHSQQNFLERLVYFWGDHFTAHGKRGLLRRGTSPYLEEAIRPYITARFGDLLKAAVTHPLMVHYLDQESSVGIASKRALKAGGKLGLNENLAREVLELHTLGVEASYTQTDVQQLAELLTGLTYTAEQGVKFRKDFAEPGTETVLGKTYGPEPALGPIHEVLDDLAAHPATARHIAQKLAVHFVADAPDPALVTHLEQAYLANDGALLPVYAALIEHPASWQTTQMNMKHPVEFVSSAMRALNPAPQVLAGLNEKAVIRNFYTPMTRMGQTWQNPIGPDGWPEEDAAWVTPQGLSARMDWAIRVPQRVLPDLPDPREFVRHALGDSVPDVVNFAASAAESRSEAIGLVLMSPAFQRR